MTKDEKTRKMVSNPGEEKDVDGQSNLKSIKKTPGKVNSSSKKGMALNAVPKFNDKGICSNCKSDQAISESICCHLCGDRFHACCREKTGSVSSYAICPPTSHKTLMPLIAKYGQANALRWGNIMFMCNKCEVRVQKLKNPQNSYTAVKPDYVHSGCQTEPILTQCDVINSECQTVVGMSDFISSSCQTDSVVSQCDYFSTGCQTEHDSGQSGVANQLNESYETPHSVSGPELMKDISSLLSKMKTDILNDVNNLIESKFEPPPQVLQEDSTDEDAVNKEVTTYASKVKLPVNLPVQSLPNVEESKHTTAHETQDQIVVLSTTSQNVVVNEITQAIDTQFKNIPFNYVKTNPTNKKIILGFPSEKDACAGKHLLDACQLLKDSDYSIVDAKKVYPKITVSNIPNHVVSHIIAEKSNFSPNDYRDQLKTFLLSKILEKNEFIDNNLKCGKVFEIVYVNVGKDTVTLGIKISPTIRDYLLTNKRIYVGNSRCSVVDRFNIKQCFRCQKIGHISTDCKEDHMICMYCSASHSTGNCPNKKNKSSHKCRNCAQSKDSSVSALCDSHHSGSDDCPTIIKEKKKLQDRTDYSKNL